MFGGGQKPNTFGQQANTSAFGFNNTQGFAGAGTNQFQKQPSFNGQVGFGQPQQQTTSLFGAAQPQQQQQQQQQPAGGIFGQQNAAPSFGAPAVQSFGGGGFGQPAAQNTSLFGAAAPAANTSLFGAAIQGGGFGAAKPSFGFSQPQPTTSLFGQASTAQAPNTTGIFGQQQQQQQQQIAQPSGLFGNAQPSFGGAQQLQPGANGSAIAKYQPSIGSDTIMKNGASNNVSTKQHCITAMKEYEAKSLEELRFEDYSANRKGPQAGGVVGGTSLFGAAAPSTGLFGATTSQSSTGLFGQPAENKSLFGQAPSALGGFGQPQNTGFGAAAVQQPAAGGLFGKPFSAPTATTASSFSTFNTTNTQSNLFGTKPFGAPQATGLFGQPAVSQPSAFGQPAATGFTGFGTPAVQQPNSLFGNPADNKPAFGLPASSASNTGFGGFGTTNTNAGGGLFGQKAPTTSFGFPGQTSAAPTAFTSFAQPAAGSLFNKNPTPAFTGFGQQAAAPILGGLGMGQNTSLFGNNAAKPGLFGQTQPPSSLFGNTGFGNTSLGGIGTGIGTMNPLGGVQQQPSISVHQQILSLATSPFGDNPIFKDLKPIGPSEESLKTTNPAAQKALFESNQYKVSPKVSTPLRVKPVGSVLSKKSLFEGLEEYDSSVEECFTLKTNAKRLVIKPKSSVNGNNISHNNLNTSLPVQNNQSPMIEVNSNKHKLNSTENFQNIISNSPITSSDPDTSRRVSWLTTNALDKVRQNNRPISESVLETTLSELVGEKGLTKPGNKLPITQETIPISPGFGANISGDSITMNRSCFDESQHDFSINYEPHPTGIVLRRHGYYIIPTLDDCISYLNEDGKCIVPNFTIGREGYGNVYFADAFNIAGLNLDQIVHFRHKEVVIYPDDENKPPIGEGLNRKAQITLDQVWPHDKTNHESIKDPERLSTIDFEGKLRRVCQKHNTNFLEYRPESGSWVFKVDHFSKYGLSDTDDEDDSVADPKKAKLITKNIQQQQQQQKDPKAVVPTSTIDSLSSQKNRQSINENFQKDSSLLFQNDYSRIDHSYLDDEYGMSSYKQTTSPSSALAMDVGTDSHKLQLMKSSFFDDYDNKSVTSEFIDDRDSPDQMVPHKLFLKSSEGQKVYSLGKQTYTLSSQASAASSLEVITKSTVEKRSELFILNQIAQTAAPPLFILKPKVALIKFPSTVIPMEESIVSKINGNNFSDSAFMFGRNFKIGWGAKNVLVTLNTTQNCQQNDEASNINNFSKCFNGRQTDDFSSSMIQLLQISSTKKINKFNSSIEPHLQICLDYSNRQTVETSDCPYFTPGGGNEALNKHYDLSKQLAKIGSMEEYCVSVWDLCSALWGEHDEFEDRDLQSHEVVMGRREFFSSWLENVITDKGLMRKSVNKAGYLDHLLELLMCHKVSDACELAFNNDDCNLALLLSQLSSGPTTRQLIQHQLSSWQGVEADKFINPDRLKALMLVAGLPLISSTHGTINIFENIEWLKALAVHIWYLCSPTTSITDALLMYEKAFKSEECYVQPPLPPYTSEYNTESNQTIYDLRYHLLKLYSKRSHSIEKLLNPATHTSDPMDFRLSWMILQTLQTLGYNHCSELSESQIHVSFANQLENFGLWHWSIYVLLHIRNQSQRELCIQKMLYQYISLSEDVEYLLKENFLLDELGLPENWIFWAKAVKAGAENLYHEQAKYYLKAKRWSLAHEVIMNHIAPDAIVNGNIPYIKSLLFEFTDRRLISNWLNQGQILLDYIDLSEKFENLKYIQEEELENCWEGLKPQLIDLCSRINLFPCPTSKHRLCQSEIAHKIACLLRGTSEPCSVIQMALEKLPLPQEYAQQELRVLLDTFLVNDLENDYRYESFSTT